MSNSSTCLFYIYFKFLHARHTRASVFNRGLVVVSVVSLTIINLVQITFVMTLRLVFCLVVKATEEKRVVASAVQGSGVFLRHRAIVYAHPLTQDQEHGKYGYYHTLHCKKTSLQANFPYPLIEYDPNNSILLEEGLEVKSWLNELCSLYI